MIFPHLELYRVVGRKNVPDMKSRTYSWRAIEPGGMPLAERSGIEVLRDQIDNPDDGAPIAQTLGWRLVHAEEGLVRLALPVGEHLMHGGGIVHGGVLSTLCDSAMANAVMSKLHKGQRFTTTQLNLNFIRAVSGSGEISCEGRVVKLGNRVTFTEATVQDCNGAVCVTATSTYVIL